MRLLFAWIFAELCFHVECDGLICTLLMAGRAKDAEREP